MFIGVHGARPNVICNIFEEGLVELFASNLLIEAQTVATIAIYMLL